MSKKNIARYSRRMSAGKRPRGKLVAVLLVLLFVVLCVVASMAVGIWLGNKAEAVGSDAPKYTFERVEYTSGNKRVRSVEAYHFSYGANAVDYASQDISDFSFCLRHADGSLDYRTSVSDALGVDSVASEILLGERVKQIHSCGGYACGYFYVMWQSIDDVAAREAYKAYELSLIMSASESGVDSILLLGLDVNENSIAEAEDFVARASCAAEHAVVGVALKKDIFLLAEREIYLAGRIGSSCDYLALDLRELQYKESNGEAQTGELETLVDQMYYYIKEYGTRLVFSAESSKLYKEALSLGIVDFQIVGS